MVAHKNLDPELVAPMLAVQGFMDSLDLRDIRATREAFTQMQAAGRDQLPVIEGVSVENRKVPGREGDPDVLVRIYRPTARSEILPALLWIHGGGYVLGDAEGNDQFAKQLVKDVGCLVASVDYRLAPEHPFPAPLEDCYAALKWLAANAGKLGVDGSRIAIGGGSAGGGLAAGLALLTRDRGEVEIVFQLLIYPMIDDRNVSPAGESLPDTPIWSREKNLIGWRCYLGREPGGEDVSCYAAASRATDLAGLPPAYIAVGELDLFLDENVEYARRLLEAGVPTELHVYPGAFHGFNLFAPDAGVSHRFGAERDQVLRRALHS